MKHQSVVIFDVYEKVLLCVCVFQFPAGVQLLGVVRVLHYP